MLYQWQVALDLKNSKNYANSVVVSDVGSQSKGFQFEHLEGHVVTLLHLSIIENRLII